MVLNGTFYGGTFLSGLFRGGEFRDPDRVYRVITKIYT